MEYKYKPYPPNTLYQLYCGIMRYVRRKKPKINFFTDPDFDGFRHTLDGVMKVLQGNGGAGYTYLSVFARYYGVHM